MAGNLNQLILVFAVIALAALVFSLVMVWREKMRGRKGHGREREPHF